MAAFINNKERNARRFNWLSSSDPANSKTLEELNRKMTQFYSGIESRNKYQEMVDSNDSEINNPGIVTSAFINYVRQLPCKTFLEVGCGTGRIFQFIQKYLEEIDYTGIEVSQTIINYNQIKFPSAKWHVAGAYKIPRETASVDVCFSFYVLEHLVYPEKALNEMLRIIKSGGQLILIFPDFSASGRFASQKIGLGNESTALQRIKKGKFFSALVSLFDSRIRLPRALKSASNRIGNFPVNKNPKCLFEEDVSMSPDIDAVYIASKNEIEKWALSKGYTVNFPAGKEGYFSEHAFVSIQKI